MPCLSLPELAPKLSDRRVSRLSLPELAPKLSDRRVPRLSLPELAPKLSDRRLSLLCLPELAPKLSDRRVETVTCKWVDGTPCDAAPTLTVCSQRRVSSLLCISDEAAVFGQLSVDCLVVGRSVWWPRVLSDIGLHVSSFHDLKVRVPAHSPLGEMNQP